MKGARNIKGVMFVSSPYAGKSNFFPLAENVETAREYCKIVVGMGYVPVAPHLLFPQFMQNDGDKETPEERRQAINMGLELLRKCDALVICGDYISSGMKAEMDAAADAEIPIYHITLGCHELLPVFSSYDLVCYERYHNYERYHLVITLVGGDDGISTGYGVGVTNMKDDYLEILTPPFEDVNRAVYEAEKIRWHVRHALPDA